MNVTPDTIPRQKTELTVIRKINKTVNWGSDARHRVSDSTVSDKSITKMTEHIEDDRKIIFWCC